MEKSKFCHKQSYFAIVFKLKTEDLKTEGRRPETQNPRTMSNLM